MTATPFFLYDSLSNLDLPFVGTRLDDSFLPDHEDHSHSIALLSGAISATSPQYIFGGSLADTLTLKGVSGKNVNFSLGAGKDVVVISKSFFGLVDTGAPNENLNDDADSVTIKGGFFGGDIFTGKGADNVTISGGTVSDAEFLLGSGDDKIKSSVSIWKSIIDLGDGNNSFSGSHFSGSYSDEYYDLYSGSGNDSVSLSGSFNGLADLGGGKDSFSAGSFSGSLYAGSDLGAATTASQVKTVTVKKSGYGTIGLSNSADVVSFGGDYGGSFYGNDGDDKMTLGRDAIDPYFDFGAGKDSLVIKRDLLITQIPSDIFLAGVNLGLGDDTASIGRRNYGSIALNEGSDRLTVNGDNLGWIDAGSGDDILFLNRDNGMTLLPQSLGDEPQIVENTLQSLSGDIYLGAGNDSLTLKGDSLSGSIQADAGDDKVTLKGDSASSVGLGEGQDILSVAGNQSGQIYAGAGNDLIDIRGDLKAHVSLESGDDTLTVWGETDTWISCGGGRDQISLKGKSFANLTSGGSSGLIQLGNDGNYLILMDELSLSIKGGSGSDLIDMGELDLAAGVNIDFGAGVDYLTVSGALYGLPETELKNLEVLRLGSTSADHILSFAEIKAIAAPGSSGFRIIVYESAEDELLTTLNITDSGAESFDHYFFAEDGEHQVYSSGDFDILIQFTPDIHIS
ncbi:MAG: Cyclolysin [Verrucomicrobiota bacterium]|jgi:hypothetical protein